MLSLLQKNNKSIIFLGMLIIAILPVLIGIFHPGFFASDDGNWMVIRLSAFYEALRQGQIPVRFLPRLNNSFGYPVADFLYPLFLYTGSFIHLFHIPYVMTIKILFGLSLIIGAFGCFLWFRKIFKNIAAFVGALVYTLFPYHIWDITKRGSLGEVLALGIAPYIFWQIEEENVVLTGLGIGTLILSHNTLALLFLPVVLGYMLLLRKYRDAVIATLLGLGLTTFFWFSALFDKQFTVFDTTVISNFSQYFLSNDLYSLIGIISFVVILFALIQVLKKPENRSTFFLVVTLISISLTTQVSRIVWQILHLGTYVQFPFRFLSLTAIGVAFLTANLLANWNKKQNIIIAGLLIILLYISSWQYIFPKSYQYYPDTFYSTNQDSTTVQNEYMPKWVEKLPTTPQKKVLVSNGNLQNMLNEGNSILFDTQTSQSSNITIATVYFPGWKVTVDNTSIKIIPQKTTGFITFPVAKGTHHIKVYFTETTQRLIADITSLAFLAAIVLLLVKKRKNI